MPKWHFFDLQTGLFTDRVLLSEQGLPQPERVVNLPGGGQTTIPGRPGITVPDGCGAVEWPRGEPLRVGARRMNLQTGQIEAYRPDAPASDALHTWEWDSVDERWRPAPTLAVLKARKWVDIKAAAAAADAQNITVQGVNFVSDVATRDELMREAVIAHMAISDGQAYSLEWERDNGASVTLNASQVKALIRAMNARTAQIRAALRTLRQQIQQAVTESELDAIAWVFP